MQELTWENEEILQFIHQLILVDHPKGKLEKLLKEISQKHSPNPDAKLLECFQKACQTKTPKQLQDLKSEAWGFDFYRTPKVMLLRFDPYFHSRYIQGTERDEIFKKIPTGRAIGLIQNSAIKSEEKQKLLARVKSRQQDIYCRIDYREGDYNVIMRLRAWGPNVEVLLPGALREQMAKDIQETWKLYHS